MCERSPPAIQPHASGNVNMVGIGIKLEEAPGEECGVRELQQSSPLCKWSPRISSDPEKSTARITQSPMVRMMLVLRWVCEYGGI